MKTLDLRHQVQRCIECGQRYSSDAKFCPFDGSRLERDSPTGITDPLLHARVDDRYEVQSVIGEGGMGTVYRVRHVTLERTFAMKVLKVELAQDEKLALRFLHEAKSTAAVKHPQIVSVSDFGRLPDGRPYFVMELLTGRTLSDAIRNDGALNPTLVARIVERVARGMAAAHEVNVIHRDLKPENVFLLDATGLDVRVVDFGAARVVGASRLTKTGVVFGTPHYMAPEQAMGKEVDARADVYALGVVLYEALTGQVPFEADTFMGVISQHLYVVPSSPSTLLVSLDSRAELGLLDAVCMRALEKAPEARYPTMIAFADALHAALRDVGAPPVTPSRPAGAREPRSLVFPVALAASAIGVLLLLLIAAQLRGPRGDEPPAVTATLQAAHADETKPSVEAGVAAPSNAEALVERPPLVVPPLEPPPLEPPRLVPGAKPRAPTPGASARSKATDDFRDPWR